MRWLVSLTLLLTTVAPLVVRAEPLPDISNTPPKKFRFISLAEVRAIALENKCFNQPSLLTPPGETPIKKPGSLAKMGVRTGTAGLVLTGIPRSPRPAECERDVNQLLLNVQNAYWNLYGSYGQLHSREQALRLAYDTWMTTRILHEQGKAGVAAVAQAEGQYNLFRSQRMQALDTVLDNERQLRAIAGMKCGDGLRLVQGKGVRFVPCDSPSLVEKKADWKEGLECALRRRPELYLARKALAEEKIRCVESEIRQASYEPVRTQLVLRDQETKAERFLGLYYRRMSSSYFQIKAARAQREAFAKQMKVRDELYRNCGKEEGSCTPVSLNLLLEAQRFWAEALSTEYQAIVTYNNSLAGWEYAKGAIMDYAHVRFGKEPREGTNKMQASVREHQRTVRQVRNERGLCVASPMSTANACVSVADNVAPSLPALWKYLPPLKIAMELPTLKGDAKDSKVGPSLVAWQVDAIFPPK